MSALSTFRKGITAFIENSFILQAVRNSARFPGLRIHPITVVRNEGRLEYGRSVTIRRGANIHVPRHAILEIGDGVWISDDVDLLAGERLTIGAAVTIQRRTSIGGDVTIGRNCIIAPNCFFSTGRHVFDKWPWISIRDQERRWKNESGYRGGVFAGAPITVDEDCWIGTNVVIVEGVHIGKGCVVGANAVVTRSLEPYTIAAGSPARPMRRRLEFDPPSTLSWHQDEHRPYFYSGFEASDDLLPRATSCGGWDAGRTFSLAIPRAAKSDVRVRCRAHDGPGVDLTAFGQTVRVTDREQLFSFSIVETELQHVPGATLVNFTRTTSSRLIVHGADFS